MNAARRWLQVATVLLWLPLVMAGGSWLLKQQVVAPSFIALLSLSCLLLAVIFLWLGVAQLLRRPIRMADLVWLGLFGLGALLYTQLAKVLSP